MIEVIIDDMMLTPEDIHKELKSAGIPVGYIMNNGFMNVERLADRPGIRFRYYSKEEVRVEPGSVLNLIHKNGDSSTKMS